MSSGITYASGRARLIGFGRRLTSIAALDPARYEGAALYYEGDFLYSDGEQWKIPTETRPIVRPSALVPTNAAEQAQLRLTEFLSPLGLQQTSVVFEVSLSGDFENDRLFQRVSTDPNASVYDILFPDDGISPGQAFFWRGLYTATGGQQSDWSSAYRQVYPDLITPPVPLTRPFAITATLAISPYESIFGLNYIDTEFEIYDATGATRVATTSTTTGGSANLPEGLEAGISYAWRGRYRGRVGLTGDLVASRWTTLRPFVNATNTMLLTYDLTKGSAGSTITLPLGLHTAPGALPTVTDVVIDWGDGTLESVTSNGALSHSYDLASLESPLVEVKITGTLSQWGGDIDQSKLVRVDFLGFGMGLRSLYRGFMRAPNLSYITEELPDSVTSLAQTFLNNATFNLPQISSWATRNVTDMSYMFRGCTAFNQPIGAWNTGQVTSFERMFEDAVAFDQDIGAWDVARVTTMAGMFNQAGSFNNGGAPTINDWNTASLTNISALFRLAVAFNQPIENWDVSGVTNMGGFGSGPFQSASSFNQPLGNWDVSNVTNMSWMFYQNTGFNNGGSPNIANWNTAKVTTMQGMFAGAASFDQAIGAWDVSGVSSMRSMFSNASRFDNGGSPDINGWDTAALTDVYGMFERASRFNQPIGGWNITGLTSLSHMFYSVSAAIAFDQDLSAWDVSRITTFRNMFHCPNSRCDFNNGGSPGINSWNVSAATELAGMFATCHRFNQPLGSWNTANVTTMADMFSGADAFDQDIGAWDTGAVQSFRGMFNEANGFNNGGSAAIGAWNTSACTDFSYMFQITNSSHPFNQPIGAWDVSKATTLRGMFHNRGFGTSAFDQDISTWRLNRDGVDLAEFGITNLSRVNYSKLLTAWGNLVFDQQGPFAASLFTEGSKIYDSTVYAPGDTFETAIAARSFLVAPAQITIAGASVAAADGTYTLSGPIYESPSGWYLANSSVTWTLFDNLGNAQASGNAPPEGFNGPSRVTLWSGVLAGASVLRTGAAWSITGDTQQ